MVKHTPEISPTRRDCVEKPWFQPQNGDSVCFSREALVELYALTIRQSWFLIIVNDEFSVFA